MNELESKLQAAAEAVTRLAEAPDNQTKLKLYGLYKQATQGDVSGDKPGMFDFVGNAKYGAWEALRGTSREQASEQYIALVADLQARQG